MHRLRKTPRVQRENAKVTYSKPQPDPREIIESLRVAKGFRSLRQVSEQAGISQPTLSRFMNGTTKEMDLASLQALCRLFGVTLSELLGEVPLSSSSAVREVQRALTRMTDDQQQQLARIAQAMLPPATRDKPDPA